MKNTDINSIASQTRETLKKEFPACKFSVTVKKYSGGRTMTIALLSGPFQAMLDNEYWQNGYVQLNRYQLREGFDRRSGTQTLSNKWVVVPEGYALSNGAYISDAAWNVLQRALEVGDAENWDNSDSMTDYFDVNYYLDIEIGKYSKPYEQK